MRRSIDPADAPVGIVDRALIMENPSESENMWSGTLIGTKNLAYVWGVPGSCTKVLLRNNVTPSQDRQGTYREYMSSKDTCSDPEIAIVPSPRKDAPAADQ
jgi:hypothetical protein